MRKITKRNPVAAIVKSIRPQVVVNKKKQKNKKACRGRL